jgi:hypothetical protein
VSALARTAASTNPGHHANDGEVLHRGRPSKVRPKPAAAAKVVVNNNQPRGKLLLQTTNGVRTKGEDAAAAAEVSSQASTPVGDGAAATNGMLAGPWKKEETRALRSKAGGTRLKSDLAVYFSNFDDIIMDAPKSTGMGQ